MGKKLYLLLAIMLVPHAISAQEITLGFGIDKPPFITGDEEGVEIDIAREAFKRLGYSKINISHMSNKRIVSSLKNGEITSGPVAKGNPGADFCYSSTSFIDFHNFVITRESSDLKPKSVEDLANPIYDIAAFQNAVVTIGPEYAEVVRKNKNYHEFESQKSQVKMFLSGRKNSLVIDRYIYQYWAKILQPQERPQVLYHPLFDKVNSLYFGFRAEDKELCEKFSRALKSMKNDGTYNKILGKRI